MGYNWVFEKMKKAFLVILAIIGLAFTLNAQVGTTKAVPISNGCGSESSKASQVGASIAKPVDAIITGTSIKTQNASCDQHDKDYYNGVDKKKADDDFQTRSPIMGTAVKTAKGTSNNSYREAQKDRETSKKLQPTWEKENKQCLDGNNYRVTPNK